MQARRTLAPGQKGAKKFLDRYGEQLVCVRCDHDEQRRKRFTTVEIIVEESGWFLPEKPAIVGLRVDLQETELQRRVKQAGGKWNSAKRVWGIHYGQAVALGLKKRIVKLEVSSIGHKWLRLDTIASEIIVVSGHDPVWPLRRRLELDRQR